MINRIILLLSALLAFGTGGSAIAAVGRTPGALAVSATGATTYTIPLFSPPGPHGLKPQIALAYDSQRGAGSVGVGWRITGLSYITRCNRTVAQDTVPAAVALVTSDGYCLDGQRLRLTGGTYGTAGSTYQTEIANFASVTAQSVAGQGPSYFTATDRNGVHYRYGAAGNSQVLAPGGTSVLTWQLDQVTDTAGNYMTIVYNTLNGTSVPSGINWAHVSGSTNYIYSMAFNYGTRDLPQNTTARYVAGVLTTNSNLLQSITVYTNSTAVKDYFLTYQTSPTTGRDELISVKECADTGATNCLAPTSISYQNGAIGVSTAAATASLPGSSLFYDFNGDGRPDVIYSNGTNWVVQFNTGTGFGAAVNTGVAASVSVIPGDLLGTGTDGYLALNGTTLWYYHYNSSTGSFSGTDTHVAPAAGYAYQLTDITGDGLPDLVGFQSASASVQTLSNMSTSGVPSFATAYTFVLPTPAPKSGVTRRFFLFSGKSNSAHAQRSLDFNGDGRKDLVFHLTSLNVSTGVTTDHYNEAISQGANQPFLLVSIPFDPQQGPPIALGNFNDDACTDAALGNMVYYSGCNGAIATTVTLPGATTMQVAGAMDWDGDGRSDLIASNPPNTGYFWYQSTGTGFAAPQAISSPYFVDVVDFDGDGEDDISAGYGGSVYLHNGPGTPPDLLNSITDGYGNSAGPLYGSITQGHYTPWNDQTYPNNNYIGPLYVTYQVTFSDASTVGAAYNQTYYYAGAAMNLQGLGFAGFGAQQQYDSRTTLWDTRDYSRIFPTTGMLSYEVLSQDNLNAKPVRIMVPTLTSATLDGTANNQRYFPYLSNVTTKTYEVGGAENTMPVTTRSTSYTFDTYGNATDIVSTLTDTDPGSTYLGQSWITSTHNTTDISSNTAADLAANCLSLLDQTQVIYTTSPASTSITRTQNYTPDPTRSNCRIQTIITQPGDARYQVTEGLTFDAFGNVATDTITGANMPASPASRVTKNTWSANGQFLVSQTDPTGVVNSAGGTTTWNYSSALSLTFGLPDSVMNANNLTMSWTYDAFGRRVTERRPDGTATGWTLSPCTSYCGWSNSVYQVATTQFQTNGTTAIRTDTSYYDPVDRVTDTFGPTVTGTNAVVQRKYDALGRLVQQSTPYLAGGTAYQQTTAYDVLGRPMSSSRPISSTNATLQTTQFGYAGLTSTVTDPYGHTKTIVRDPNGWQRKTKDALGYTVITAYDAAGSVIGITDSVGNALLKNVSYSYGIKPFMTAATDADLGAWSYGMDSLGEVYNWTDAKGQNFSITYDALSRPLSRTEPDQFTQWTYGTTPASLNVGQLIYQCNSAAAGSSCGATPAYSETRTFDNLGRLSTRAITQVGNAGNNTGGSFQFTYGYGITGQLSSLTYPISTGGFALNLLYTYQNGVLHTITDASDSTTTCGTTCILWTANGMSARGQVSQETLGNNVVINRTFDPVTSWLSKATGGVGGGAALLNQSYLQDENGNTIQRQNNNAGLTESFAYDADNRLTCAALAATCTSPTIAYDGGVAGPGNISSQSGTTYNYPAAGQPRPHAVTSLVGTFNGIVNPPFSYDANGNMTARASTGANIVWASSNYPTSISFTSPVGNESVAFSYGPDRQRWKQTYTGLGTTENTYYIGGLLDLVFNGGTTTYRHYIFAGNEPVALYSRTAAGVNAMSYLLEDHQGSISSIVSNAGAVDVNESFGPFGYRRNPATWSGAPSAANLATIAGLSRQGYTSQTALGQYMGLNHMNGRVQDALLGRFFSPDPNVPDPTNAQSYNRYSYVLNNPVTLTDPSGFDPCGSRLDDNCKGFRADVAQGVRENARIRQALNAFVNDFANAYNDWVGVPTVDWGVESQAATGRDNGQGQPSGDQSSDYSAQSGCYSLCLEPNATPAEGQSGISYGPATVGSFSCGSGTCTYNMGTYDNPAFGQNGVSIQVNNSAADSGGEWVQTYTRSGGSPQYDVDAGASNSIYTGNGTTAGHFVDTPGINYGTNGSFSAQTTYVVPNSSGGYSPVFTFSWSAQQSSSGVTFTTPFVVPPSSFQWSAIVTAYH